MLMHYVMAGSVRAEATWPSLIIVGPRRSSSSRTHPATTACTHERRVYMWTMCSVIGVW